MKIAYNPITAAAVITAATAVNDDILFDLKAKKIWAKGLRMGADWADITSKPSSLKNPAAIKFKDINGNDVSYDGSVAKDLTPGTYIARLPYGFSSFDSKPTWGNTTGTSIACWKDASGGSIDFRKDNPASGKLSIKVDGRVYVNEGINPVLSAESNNGFWGMRTPDGGNDWIRTSNNGLLPYKSGGAGNGSSSLGTNSWYFSTAYIDKVYGSLKGNADTATTATTALKADKLTNARNIALGTDLRGSANFDGSGNITINATINSCLVSVGSTDKLHFKRIAHFETANSYNDNALLLYISQGYINGNNGICRIEFRTNNISKNSTSVTASAAVRWLVRNGYGLDSLYAGYYVTTGKAYIDIYLKTTSVYQGTAIRVLQDSRGSINSNVQLISAKYNSDTDYKEAYDSIEAASTALYNRAYTKIVSGRDVGVVNYANSAGSANKWTTARTFTIGNTAKNVDGSGNVSWSLAEIGVRDTWRTVQVNGTSIGNNTLNLCNSTYIGLTNVNGKVTFSLVGSSTTANQAILSNGTANGWTLKTLNIANWDTAYNLRHSHANKSVLDGITSGLVTNWNTAYTFVSTITGTDTDNVINKWDEIVNFLAGITEDNKLNTLLNSKLSVYQLADKTNVGAIKNNGIYYSTTDASSNTLTNSPFNNGFTLINMTSLDNGDNLRRSRLAFNAFGEIKVSDDRDEANTAETWYNVLTSKNSSIKGSTITLNGTSITVYSSGTADGRYVKKSGDTMTGALNFANATWNKVGDDVAMGDCNAAGCLGIKGLNAGPGLAFYNSSNTLLSKLVGTANQFQRVSGNDTYTIIDTASSYITNGVYVFGRSEIGNSPNYDNPQKNGLFEIRGSSEVAGETGTRPTTGYGAFLNLKTPDNVAMLQISGMGNSLYFRARQAASVTMAGVSWKKVLDTGNSYVRDGKGVINGTTITQVDNADKLDGYHASGLLTALSNSNRGISLTVGGTTKSLSNISVGDADTVDGYNILEESKQIYKYEYTVDNPTGAWILIKLPAFNAYNEIVTIDGRGNNRQAHCIVHCGSRNQGIWGYQSEYNGITVNKIRWIDGGNTGKYAIVALIDEGITTLKIRATNSLEISKTTEDTKAFTITANFFSIGGSFYGKADSAAKIGVTQHTINDSNYPLVWSSQSNANSAIENQLFKSWQDLYYNPKNKRLFVGGAVSTTYINATKTVTSAGFKHSAITEHANQYVLTADGGYTFLNQTSNETPHEFSKAITVTSEWADIPGFNGGSQDFLTQPGTYIVQVYYNTSSANKMYEGYFSGVMSWYTGKTNSNNADEIVLHRAGHAYTNTIYLRTMESPASDSSPYTKLQISANTNLTQNTYKFKFKRIC